MKKTRYSLLVSLFILVISFAQTPEKISYQAVVRDATNALVANQSIGLKISILQNSETGDAVYTETYTPITNAYGLITIVIGTDASNSSSTFSEIDWSEGPYFIKTEIDTNGGTDYTITVTSELMSVPYALHTKYALHAKAVKPPVYNLNTVYEALGGFVIEVNDDGTHGLVVSMKNITSNFYTADEDLNNNPNNHGNYTCSTKFKDWRLPTLRELQLIYKARNKIDGLEDCPPNSDPFDCYSTSFMSSSEVDDEYIYTMRMKTPTERIETKKKDYNRIMRGVRSF